MKYEEEGLFIGLISYPFFIDGGNIYRGIIKDFFQKQHRENYLERLSPKLDAELYNPVAYRMFGSHGLAVLALIDDYAFCSRIFNSGHIRIPSEAEGDNMFKSIALMGMSGPFEDSNKYLLKQANSTFLRSPEEGKKLYPFIGIIRIKLEYSLLKGRGCSLTTSIRNRIERLKDLVSQQIKKSHEIVEVNLESIVVDAYDNDEMIVVAFSNSIYTLDSYLKEIRRISFAELDLKEVDKQDIFIKHVCASCHMSYGYHVDFSFKVPNYNIFFSWDKQLDSLENQKSAYSVNCLIETKPGHRNDFCNYLNYSASYLFKDALAFDKTVTGGSIVHVRIPLEEIETLHKLAADNSLEFRKHVRRIKLTLNDNHQQPKDVEEQHNHNDGEEVSNLLKADFIHKVKDKLTDLGISKIVRERLLSLLDLFNDCGRNKLHWAYFKQLKPAVLNIDTILADFQKNNESLHSIEYRLNEEISALETAFYNRMHNRMTPNMVLEYGGGIQQFLQAFGFAYREVVRILSPAEAEKNYTMVTGVSKESSLRTHAELNINHIIYPQLFCVTTWKEASNFTLRLLDDHRLINKRNEPTVRTVEAGFKKFRKFIQNKNAFNEIFCLMIEQTELMRSDSIYQMLKNIITPETIKYSLHDFIVYHFAFQRDFELMWRYYLKIFLQTPSVYHRRGEIDKKAFLFVLLRLLLVAFRERDLSRKQSISAFLDGQRLVPFDSVLSEIWFESFEKIESAASNFCKNLQSFDYSNISDWLILYSEYQLIHISEDNKSLTFYLLEGFDPKRPPLESSAILSTIIETRKAHVDSMVYQMENGTFDDSFYDRNLNSPDNTISLMNAFLIVIDHLDCMGDRRNILTYTVPRNYDNGEIDYEVLQELRPYSSNILADPIGGFIIPDHAIRKKFFAYRTLLYRTLWNMSFLSSAFN